MFEPIPNKTATFPLISSISLSPLWHALSLIPLALASSALSPTAEARMSDWVRADPTTKHGEHRYDIESWGITEASIRGTFSQYREMHGYA